VGFMVPHLVRFGGRGICRGVGGSRYHVWFDLGIESFVEVLGGSMCHICLDLGVEVFVEALGDSLCCVCLNLGVEAFIEAHLSQFGCRGVC